MALYGTISRYHLEILLSQPTAQLLQHSPDCGEGVLRTLCPLTLARILWSCACILPPHPLPSHTRPGWFGGFVAMLAHQWSWDQTWPQP